MNRVNKIRILWKRFDYYDVYKGMHYQTFYTPLAAAPYIMAFSNQKNGCRVQIGNRKGWVDYDFERGWDLARIVQALTDAKEMHLAFYDDGEAV
jgi:hypothetical protein